MEQDKSNLYVNGRFEWDTTENYLQFISFETTPIVEHEVIQVKPKVVPEEVISKYSIGFKEDLDITDKILFRRKYRRKLKMNDPPIILLQDIKDIALYTANPKTISRDFVSFLHSPGVDRYLRALIVYFQYYMQSWNRLRINREELKSKITNVDVEEKEVIIREDLSVLRSIVAREYYRLLTGGDDPKKFYYCHYQVIVGEHDRRLFEYLTQMSSRIVWYALHKPYLSAIVRENDRLGHSNYFNRYEHQCECTDKPYIKHNANELLVLRGRADFKQQRLYVESPLSNEIMSELHDHRILGVGHILYPPEDERLHYLEKLFFLPEEDFEEHGICVGILGMPLSNFDVVLKQKRKKVHDDDVSVEELDFTLKLPIEYIYDFSDIDESYCGRPAEYKPKIRYELLEQQCRLWLERLDNYSQEEALKDVGGESIQSILNAINQE